MDDKTLISRAGTLSALDLARAIEAGTMTPGAVVDLCTEAIARHEPEIGAFAALDITAARRTAVRADLTGKPLRGLPVGIKDIFDTADFPTRYGSPIYAGHQPKSDAALVALVRRAGGLVLGKTVTAELASLQPPATRNPRNPAHTPGGSSSGSAAPSRPAWCRSRSAARPAARSSGPPPFAVSPATSRRSGSCRPWA